MKKIDWIAIGIFTLFCVCIVCLVASAYITYEIGSDIVSSRIDSDYTRVVQVDDSLKAEKVIDGIVQEMKQYGFVVVYMKVTRERGIFNVKVGGKYRPSFLEL